MDRMKYTKTNIRLMPHARWTDPLGSAAQELKTLSRTWFARDKKELSPETFITTVLYYRSVLIAKYRTANEHLHNYSRARLYCCWFLLR